MKKNDSNLEYNLMTRTEIISYMRKNPGVKVTHVSFDRTEYLYMKDDECIYDESDYLFENWDPLDRLHYGMRMRSGGLWEIGWSIYNENNDETSYTDLLNLCKDFGLNEKLERSDFYAFINYLVENDVIIKHKE